MLFVGRSCSCSYSAATAELLPPSPQGAEEAAASAPPPLPQGEASATLLRKELQLQLSYCSSRLAAGTSLQQLKLWLLLRSYPLTAGRSSSFSFSYCSSFLPIPCFRRSCKCSSYCCCNGSSSHLCSLQLKSLIYVIDIFIYPSSINVFSVFGCCTYI